ncbi:MAG: hypothetical protein ABI378_08670 [Chitinophagaceae bacterium]
MALNARERFLSIREQALDLREQQISGREKKLDSTFRKIAYDSLVALHSDILGRWTVKMQCTETTCLGSAVGDTKNEIWEIKFENQFVIIDASSNGQLVRVYSGAYDGAGLKLSVKIDSVDASAANMEVRLMEISATEMQGEREIRQTNGCRILYSLKLKKQ